MADRKIYNATERARKASAPKRKRRTKAEIAADEAKADKAPATDEG